MIRRLLRRNVDRRSPRCPGCNHTGGQVQVHTRGRTEHWHTDCLAATRPNRARRNGLRTTRT